LANPTTLGRDNPGIVVFHIVGAVNDPPKEILQKISVAAGDGDKEQRIALCALARANPMPKWVSDILLTAKLPELQRRS